MSQAIVVAICAAIGTVTVVVTMAVGHRSSPSRVTEEYGKRLIVNTAEYLGPFIPNRLACASCHIDAGAEPGELSLATAFGREHLEQRIDQCVTRNMNGRPLPGDSLEMRAMIAWLRFLSDRNAAMGAGQRQSHDPPAFRPPLRAADPRAGELLFDKRCADCHGKDGAGLPASRDLKQGYLFPPLWGPESFSDDSEMHNPATAARFIKAKMPLGRPDLDDDQAFDVAAFIHTRPRPHAAKVSAADR
jgi:thiosulfate dehydrogenase